MPAATGVEARFGVAGLLRRQRQHVQERGVAIGGVKAGFDNGGTWTAYVEGRNLSDRAYIASTSIVGNASGADLPLFNPGSGQEVYAGVQYRW